LLPNIAEGETAERKHLNVQENETRATSSTANDKELARVQAWCMAIEGGGNLSSAVQDRIWLFHFLAR
jgi:hypothetical protein